MRVDELDAALPVPLQHHLLARPWGHQHVVEAGEPTAPPVLLVHGWPQHWFAWRHLIGPLSLAHRVLAVDLRGFGWSDGVRTRGNVIRQHVDDLIAVLDALAVPQVGLVSHDWGGWIAFRTVEGHPDRFSAHTALAIMPPWLEVRSLLRHVVDWSYVFPMAAFGNLIARRAAIVRFLVHRSTADPTTWDAPSEREALASYLERVARPPAATMTRALYGAFVRRELLAAIRADGGSPVPTTVVVGEHETIARPELWQQRTSQGQVHLTTIAGADHWLAEEAPQATLAAITAGLARR